MGKQQRSNLLDETVNAIGSRSQSIRNDRGSVSKRRVTRVPLVTISGSHHSMPLQYVAMLESSLLKKSPPEQIVVIEPLNRHLVKIEFVAGLFPKQWIKGGLLSAVGKKLRPVTKNTTMMT